MNRDAWRDFPGAPPPGTVLCPAAAIPEKGVKSLDLDGFPVLLVASAEGLRAYVNACPHQYLPLDWRSPNILSENAEILRCSNHDAGFDAATGQGIDGLGQGCALDPVPVTIRGDALVIG
ncbi:Rieske (2Fe-2S) protein [Roseicyclus persicicus]|uniref:Rieske 2Fe-2S domain-containing protein n=1 Tax=Roseicyclus persicicus TaxID=2650661 RepID=A0A7X6H0G2_9RHOB|nr:Rieske 2Fe-2S domain-containing protein [Roseibacterium persicicum]NKX45708.1 Rieske 2Fe-2S domain-containing protein [Roseibacterium persicicum]